MSMSISFWDMATILSRNFMISIMSSKADVLKILVLFKISNTNCLTTCLTT